MHSGHRTVRLQRCPGCQGETQSGDLIAGLCPTCFSDGKPLPIGALEPLTTRTLVRVGRGMRDTVKPDATRCIELHQQEGGESVADSSGVCEWCHERKANKYEHRKVCKMRPAEVGNGGAGRRVAEKTKAVAVVARPSSVPEPRGDTTPRVVQNGHCVDSLFRDLGRYIE